MEKKDYTLLDEGHGINDVAMLSALVKKDPKIARILFMNSDRHRFQHERTCLFRIPNTYDFDIVKFRVKVGVSVTNKFYRHSKRMVTLRYREKSGFWLVVGGRIQRPTAFSGREWGFPQVVTQFLATEFAWYKTMIENKIEFNRNFTLHTVWSKKLFTLNKLLKGHYGVPIQAAKTLHSVKNYNNGNQIIYIQYYSRFMKNVENISAEILGKQFRLFYDSLKMAKTLDRVVNCSWGLKRLKEEHDAWSAEINNVMYIADNRPLKIRGVFTHFMEYSGYDMKSTTRLLAEEGIKQKHCVGTYVRDVDTGGSAIFHVEGYTLEVKTQPNPNLETSVLMLCNAQFRGFRNSVAPVALREKVQLMLDSFNKEFAEHECLNSRYYKHPNEKLFFDNVADTIVGQVNLDDLNLVEINEGVEYVGIHDGGLPF
jgi:hypothetical protein